MRLSLWFPHCPACARVCHPSHRISFSILSPCCSLTCSVTISRGIARSGSPLPCLVRTLAGFPAGKDSLQNRQRDAPKQWVATNLTGKSGRCYEMVQHVTMADSATKATRNSIDLYRRYAALWPAALFPVRNATSGSVMPFSSPAAFQLCFNSKQRSQTIKKC